MLSRIVTVLVLFLVLAISSKKSKALCFKMDRDEI